MTEPILTREEVREIAARLGSQSLNVTRVHELNGPTLTIFDDAGLEEFAAAVLEKVCGEPEAWKWRQRGQLTFVYTKTHPRERLIEEFDIAEAHPLFALTRSKP